jgi:hypothetical protein
MKVRFLIHQEHNIIVMTRIQNIFLWFTLGFLLAGCINQQYKRTSLLTTQELCPVVNEIIKSPEIIKTLALAEKPQYYESIRVFTPGITVDTCRSNLGAWRIRYFNELRPSLNTGYNRDIVIYKQSYLDFIEYHVYLPSHENYENRQTTYLFRFVNTHPDSLSLIGFAEYTDH